MNRILRFIDFQLGYLNTLERWGLFVLFVGHSLAALFSYGYHHPDEHYQIFEWTTYFLGLNQDTRHLAWEFNAQIRPWFQPLLHALLLKPWIALELYNPFTASFFLRWGYSIANIWALFSLWRFFKNRYQIDSYWFLILSFMWFMPYVHARTSSENLSAIFISFAFLSLLDQKHFFRSGILFGFAFLARYQIALGLAGLGIGLIILEKSITRQQIKLFVGFLIPVFLGVIIDRIGYGNWVFTPYRYFTVNLVQGVAATFNPYPWYQYFIWILQLNPLVSVPLFWGCLSFMKRARSDDRLGIGMFVWFFFLLHLFITNKEYRFLFPIINLVPMMALVSFSKNQRFLGVLKKPSVFALYALISILAFSVSALRGASIQTLGAIYVAHENLDVSRPVLSNRDYPTQSPFYSFPKHEFYWVIAANELESKLNALPNAQVLIDGKITDAVTQHWVAVMNQNGCVYVDGALPKWFYDLGSRFPFVTRIPYIAWYDCS